MRKCFRSGENSVRARRVPGADIGLFNTILQGTVKGGGRQGRQRKRWEDNMREWTGLEFRMEKTGCKVICGAPATLVVKGLMMMMMSLSVSRSLSVRRSGFSVSISIFVCLFLSVSLCPFLLFCLCLCSWLAVSVFLSFM